MRDLGWNMALQTHGRYAVGKAKMCTVGPRMRLELAALVPIMHFPVEEGFKGERMKMPIRDRSRKPCREDLGEKVSI